MSLEHPNYYNSQDRQRYEQLVNESFKRELSERERNFVTSMYHQEEFDVGLDGDR